MIAHESTKEVLDYPRFHELKKVTVKEHNIVKKADPIINYPITSFVSL